MEAPKNSMRNMTDFSYDDKRFDKSTELNANMTIDPNKGFDQYGKAVHNLNTKGDNE